MGYFIDDLYLFFVTQSLLCNVGPKIETFMEQLRSDLVANPPLTGAFKPTKGAVCVAKFSDGQWGVNECGRGGERRAALWLACTRHGKLGEGLVLTRASAA